MDIPVKFGTSGHRGLIGSSFSYDHVSSIAQAVSTILKKSYSSPQLVIGFDPRKGNDPNMSEGSFTQILVSHLLRSGVSVGLATECVPTPLISWFIRNHNIHGGFMLTASHNPPSYNGIKFNPDDGQPAPPELTNEIELLANNSGSHPPETTLSPGSFHHFSPTDSFADHLVQYIDDLFGHRSISLHIAIDCKFGATGGLWRALSSRFDTATWSISNASPREDFGNIEPNPTHIASLSSFSQFILDQHANMGIANDPDGDRHVILDEKGKALTPEETTVIIADYFVTHQLPLKGIVTTLASSQLIQIFCKRHELFYADTEVGFKYFYPFLKRAHEEHDILMGVESSGGFTLSDHTYEKCGFLPGLLIAKILEQTGASLSSLKAHIHSTYGALYFKESSYELTPVSKPTLTELLRHCSKDSLSSFFPLDIDHIDTRDGLKLIFSNDSWLLFRLSGTEPVVRFYSESLDNETADSLLDHASRWLDSYV